MKLLYEGKGKKIFETENNEELLMVFKDDLTAFDAVKKGSFSQKGQVSQQIAEMIYSELTNAFFPHHWLRKTEQGVIVQRLKMIPLEVVVRNYAAGSLVKKFGFTEGQKLERPIVEFFLKSDSLHDPFINDEQILALKLISLENIEELKKRARELNEILFELFQKSRMMLVDFKVEFGFTPRNEIVLGDDISPDCLRAWDQETQQKFDKDLFRFDLGDPGEGYREILKRLRETIQRNDQLNK